MFLIRKLKVTLGAAFAVILMAGLYQSAVAGNYGAQKVVYHINYDNPKAQAGALRNIQNHINAVGAENLEIRKGVCVPCHLLEGIGHGWVMGVTL